MALDLSSCSFVGPALPEPFVKFDLEAELSRAQLLAATSGEQGRRLQDKWTAYRRGLRELVSRGGSIRVRNQVIEPLVRLLGYEELRPAEPVETREGQEAGGVLLIGTDGEKPLRVWTTDFETDLDAPARRGYAYRYSHVRVAQRVLLAAGERVGLLTNGVQLRILISDPARPDSQVVVAIDPDWKRSRDVPDSFRLLLALCSPKGLATVPELVDKARLKQARVTKELRVQARQAIERFVQEVLDNPNNQQWLELHPDRAKLAKDLWPEGLKIVYRLLFILKGEVSDDPARAFGFASTSLWRNTYSPSVALAPYARKVLDEGAATGGFLEHGLRTLFRLFEEGIECTELHIAPLGGALFGANTTPILSGLEWGERAVAHLLDRLLWTSRRRGSDARERVHYGSLDVEDLGRVYEALLELEPGIAAEPMCRLRRQKLEVVVPIAQGEKYLLPMQRAADSADENETEEEPEKDEAEDEAPRKKTKVEWVEAIHPGQFYLRVGLGRKTSGSFYTPHSFVRFLVQETLGPQVAERSPQNDPNPGAILKLKVLDPAMGSGHFLVEACRFLGEKLYEACRACDEKALEAERRAEAAAAKDDEAAFEAAAREATKWCQRILDLPDPDDQITRYLPSRAPEGEESGLSQKKAEALCRRLVAVHCLYGADKNPLAIELAKLSLWLESQAEGLPLTFLDHRLVLGDSLTGPFWDKLIFQPGTQQPIQDLFHQNLDKKFVGALREAIKYVDLLDASVGTTLADLENKRHLKAQLDRALMPFKVIAAAWSGGVMLGPDKCDDLAYSQLVQVVAEAGDLPEDLSGSDRLRAMMAEGLGVETIPTSREALYSTIGSADCVPALPYDLTFPEVFFPNAEPFGRCGFDAVLGNPPWNKANLEMPEFMGSMDFRFIEAQTASEREVLQRLYEGTEEWQAWLCAAQQEDRVERLIGVLHPDTRSGVQGFGAGHADIFAPFVDRALSWLRFEGAFGMVLPSAFHVSRSLSELRRKILRNTTIVSYFSFENKKALFDIHNSWKFTPVVLLNRPAPGKNSFPAQFYLHAEQWLLSSNKDPRPFEYYVELIERMDPETLIFQEFTSRNDPHCAEAMFLNSVSWKEFCEKTGWQIRRELNATEDRWRIDYDVDPGRTWTGSQRALLHHQPGTIHQFTDMWTGARTAAVRIRNLADRPRILELARYYRAAYRMTARATDERTSIYALLPPGSTATNSLPVEGSPQERPNSVSLGAIAVCNSFPFDWALRLRVGSKTVSKFIMEVTPMTQQAVRSRICVHSALRLTCNHSAYDALWREQVGDVWREPGKAPFTWPVLKTEDERWEVRSAIDAVVADAYGLSRDQYEHVLHSFDRASGPNPHTGICLEKFDELKASGPDAFTKKYDPYWDIPLVESLPKPVIDLPLPNPERSGPQTTMELDAKSDGEDRRRRR